MMRPAGCGVNPQNRPAAGGWLGGWGRLAGSQRDDRRLAGGWPWAGSEIVAWWGCYAVGWGVGWLAWGWLGVGPYGRMARFPLGVDRAIV